MSEFKSNSQTAAVDIRTGRRRFTALLASLPVIATGARAQSKYPEKPITLIVPYGTGTITDVVARQVTNIMTGMLGQPIIVDNKPGGSAQIGSTAVARSSPDGYTLLMAGDHTICVNPAQFSKLSYKISELTPVAGISMLPQILAVSATLPVKSLADLVALAKAKPGTLNFASPGIGTPAHLLGALLKSEAKIDIVHVPYQGGAQLIPDLIEGRVSMMIYPYLPIKAHVDSGKLRALASTTSRRVSWMRDVPTFTEAGYPNMSQSPSWLAVYAPAGTPADRVARLSEAFKKALETPEVVAQLAAGGVEVRYRTAGDQEALASGQAPICERLVKMANAKLD